MKEEDQPKVLRAGGGLSQLLLDRLIWASWLGGRKHVDPHPTTL